MKYALRLFAATLLFAVVAPLWVVGLAITPVAYLRQWCYTACDFVARFWVFAHADRPQDWKQETKIAGFLRRARRDRRHTKVVRP